jgi:hypothetical protein
MAVFCDDELCSLADTDRRFRDAYYPHDQGDESVTF